MKYIACTTFSFAKDGMIPKILNKKTTDYC